MVYSILRADIHSDFSIDYFRIENWYPDLKAFTFPTTFVSLGWKEARLMNQCKDLQRCAVL